MLAFIHWGDLPFTTGAFPGPTVGRIAPTQVAEVPSPDAMLAVARK